MVGTLKFGNLFVAILVTSSVSANANPTIESSQGEDKCRERLAQRPSDMQTEATVSRDARLFEEEKIRRDEQMSILLDRWAKNYAASLKPAVEKVWSVPEHKGLLVTKRKITLDRSGRIVEKRVIQDSGSKEEDQSVDNLLNSFSFYSLRPEVEKLELNMSFMSDGSMNMVDVSTPSRHDAAAFAERRRAVHKKSDVDFGPYMADLQRRIRRAWFPPKGQEMKRVVVIFKVHSGGNLSDLRLDHSSGLPSADEAALTAVQKAAPFRPLPQNAPSAVDIQYAFDYNVFSGGGRGVLRQF